MGRTERRGGKKRKGGGAEGGGGRGRCKEMGVRVERGRRS